MACIQKMLFTQTIIQSKHSIYDLLKSALLFASFSEQIQEKLLDRITEQTKLCCIPPPLYPHFTEVLNPRYDLAGMRIKRIF